MRNAAVNASAHRADAEEVGHARAADQPDQAAGEDAGRHHRRGAGRRAGALRWRRGGRRRAGASSIRR